MSDSPSVDLAHYSRALDEIYYLRAILAYEALVLDAHLGYKTFPKSRRGFAEASSERMKQAARGDGRSVYSSLRYPNQSLRLIGAKDTLTRTNWEADE